MSDDLTSKRCLPCEGGVRPLDEAESRALLARLDQWQLGEREIFKDYRFKNYHDAMAFVNATAWVSHREDHHPDIELSFNACRIRYRTHAIDGLSENDFICAAKIDALFKL